MPTWKQLQMDVDSVKDPGITLAQVNCVQYGDFCTEMKIKYYPMLNLWRNGEFVETYEGSRDLEVLQEYIEKHAKSTTPKIAPTSTELAVVVAPTSTKAAEVLHIQTPRADVNAAGTVLKLDPTNFNEVLAQGPVFIKFFAPWCVYLFRVSTISNLVEGVAIARSWHLTGPSLLAIFNID